MAESPTRYPLQWPVGWKRTPAGQRNAGNFGVARERRSGDHTWRSKEDITVAEAVQRLMAELDRFGVPEYNIVVSSNVPLRLDNMPRSGLPEPADPGAVVYWRDMGQDRCMAIDQYSKVAQNIAALAATINAMRAIERHGGAAILNRAFTGFTALPPPIIAGMKRPWREVFGYADGSTVSRERLEADYRDLAMKRHPDRGGTDQQMAELNVARAEALQEVTHG